MTFTNDELILALISLVRATHPSILRQESDGFTVDFESIDRRKSVGDDEKLLLKMRAKLESPTAGAALDMDLTPTESQRLASTLAALETLQVWPADVVAMSHSLRERLTKDN
jgi:hypothetical protein